MARLLRIVGWIVAVLVAVPLLLVALVLIVSNTGTGRHLIEQATAGFSHGQIRLQGLAGSFPNHLRAQRLTVSDSQGAWLQAQSVSLDWSPLPLVVGRLDVERLSAAQVDVLRRPISAARTAPVTHARSVGAGLRQLVRASLRLPLTVRIAMLEVPRLQLDAALAGAPVALKLSAAARYRSLQAASVQLLVQRLDQVPASYRADVLLQGARLRANLRIAEQANGPLANLLRMPALGAIAAQLQLDGVRSALNVQLDAHAGQLQARAQGTVNLTGEAANLDLTLQSPAMAPRPGLSWQQVSLQLHARGAFTSPTTQARLQLSQLVAGAVHVDSLQAQLQGEGEGISLQGQLAGLTLPAPLGNVLHAAPIGLTAHVLITAPRGARLDLSVTHPLLQAQAHYELGSLRLVATPGIAPGAAARPTGAAAAASTGGPAAAVSAATVSATTASAGATALVAGTGTISARLPHLAPWAALAHTDLQGSADLSGNFDLRSPTRTLALSAMFALSGAQTRLTALLSPRATLTAALAFDSEGIALQHSQLTAPAWQALASGREQHGQLNVRWQVALRRPVKASPLTQAANVADAINQLSIQGSVQGKLPRVSVQLSADAGVDIHRVPASVHLTMQASGLPQQPVGQLDIQGLLQRSPLMVHARLQSAGAGAGGIILQLTQASWRSVQLHGSLQSDVQLHAPGGELSLQLGRLADLGPLIGEPLGGSLEAQLLLTGKDATQRVHLQVLGHELAVGKQQLSTLQVHGDVYQPLRAPRLALTVSGAGQLPRVGAAQLSASVTGMLQALQLRASLEAAPAQGSAELTNAQLTMAGIWHEGRRQLELTALTAHYRQQTAQLQGSAEVSFENGLSVQHLRLTVPPAVIELQGRFAPTLDLHASAQNLTALMLAAVTPRLRNLRLLGRADTDINLQGSLQRPSGSVLLRASGLGSAAGAVRGLPTGSITARAMLGSGNINLDVAIDAGNKMHFRIDGRVPMSRTQPIALRMNGDLDLDLANAVLEAGGQSLTGKLHTAAQLSGTPDSPQASGELTLSDVAVHDYARGLTLSDLNASVQAQGSQLRLTKLSARAGTGTLTASGAVNLAAPGLPLQLELTGQKAQPLRSDLITTNLNLALTVSGPLVRPNLTAEGTVRVNSATINIPNGLPPQVAVLHIVQPGQAAAPAPAPAAPLIAHLDLTINAPTGIFVKGRGVNAEVGGTLHVTGNSSRPNVSGGFDLIRGTVDMAGSTLTFNSGRISFNGTGLRHRIDPSLNFQATTYSAGITATLQITGYADAPVISFSSMPPLPPDEILARLLFGESASQLTALQLASVGAALVSLTGVGGSGGPTLNPLVAIQHALGLNRLSVSSGTPGGPQVNTPTGNQPAQNNSGATIQAGRYINNRIYVGAVQSTNGLTQAQVQVTLTRALKLQTTLSTGGGTIQGATPQNDPGSSIGVTYQFQY